MIPILPIVFACLVSHVTGNNCTTDGPIVNVYCHCAGTETTAGPGKPVSCVPNNTAQPNPQPPARPAVTQPPTQPPPTLVAFSVGATNRFAPTTPTRIPFNVVLYNDGRHFHTDNAFYAPFNGIYAFTFSAVCEGSKWVRVALYTQKPGKAKVGVAKAMDYGSGGGFGTATGSVMIRLESGETVSVWTDTTADIIQGTTPPSTLFMGELKQRL